MAATVVWRRAPSSARQGAKAVVRADGTMEGWLSGACAEHTVVREALAALADGRPRLLFLGPAEEADGHRRDGVIAAPMACESEGALEVYLEPVVPMPHVVVVGRSPAVATLASLVEGLGWRTTVLDDSSGTMPASADAIVVATQGHDDEAALTAALATDAPYVGLVASAKRAAGVFGHLRGSGVDEEALLRISAPAGLDLGSIEPPEIAVAVLAELVALRASGRLHRQPVPPPTREEAVDPVCGMVVDVATARHILNDDDGRTRYFCAAGCKAAFAAQAAELVAENPV